MIRRDFVKKTSIGLAGSLGCKTLPLKPESAISDKISLGMIGIGARGMGHVKQLLLRNDIIIKGICDIDTSRINEGIELITAAGHPKPTTYSNGTDDYLNLLQNKELDAVIIATPWSYHSQMSIHAMQAGLPVACEVAGALSVKECWDLVETYEKTRTPYFTMENVAYRRDVLAVLNMVRQGIFGEMIHLQGGYEHDLREVKFNNGKQLYGGGVEFGEEAYSEAKWRTQHSVLRNGDLYPTHGLGPISNYININRGNRLLSITSISSKSAGLHNYIVNHENGGHDHKNAKVNFSLGDIVTSMIKCSNGETIILTHDTNLPRPYSLGFRVQGTKGLWMDVNQSIYLEGISPPHQWENQESYFEKYDHPLWKKYTTLAEGAGHGGMDFFVLNAFIEALKRNESMPMDVYDRATWSVVTPLSEQSIALNGAPIHFPDFTSGKWINRKTIFGLTDRY